MKMLIPDGAKIVQLRKTKGYKQHALAEMARMSERLLRDIETQGKPVPEHRLAELANSLGTTLDQIQAKAAASDETKSDGRAKSTDPHQLELHVTEKAIRLWQLASGVKSFNYTLDVDPTSQTAPLLDSVITILHRAFSQAPEDEFDQAYLSTASLG